MSGNDDENPFGVSHLVMSYHVIHQVLILKKNPLKTFWYDISFEIRADSRNDFESKWKY